MKTSNVIARVDPATKFYAESILASQGIPVSVVINMLYKQIINTGTVPFPLTPIQQDPLDEDAVSTILKGVEDFEKGRIIGEKEFFKKLKELS